MPTMPMRRFIEERPSWAGRGEGEEEKWRRKGR